jgi:hypothetical protein
LQGEYRRHQEIGHEYTAGRRYADAGKPTDYDAHDHREHATHDHCEEREHDVGTVPYSIVSSRVHSHGKRQARTLIKAWQLGLNPQ